MVQRNAHAPRHGFQRAFARRSQIDGQRGPRRQPLCRQRWADAFGCRRQIRTRLETPQPVLEVADDVIEADAAEPYGGFVLVSGIRDDDDWTLAVENGAGPGRVLPTQRDVDAAG